MSTFDGRMKEYRLVSLDRFDGENLSSTVYFLSHMHTDHTVGLDQASFFARLKQRGNSYLYCTEITRILLLGNKQRYGHLAPYVKPLETLCPTTVDIPAACDEDENSSVLVTLLPAAHCLGSVMFLFEGDEGNVLYTGDFRWGMSEATQMPYLDPRTKPLRSIYVDTTFCCPKAFHIPSREQCESGVISLVKSHFDEYGSNGHIWIESRTSFGHEMLLKELSLHMKMKIHVVHWKKVLYDQIPGLKDIFTENPEETRIHAHPKDRYKRFAKNALPCGYTPPNNKMNLIQIKPSTMWFTTLPEIVDIVHKQAVDRYRACYSFHSSYAEIRDLVQYLKPARVFPSVIPTSKKFDEVQNILNSFLTTPHYKHFSSVESDEQPLGIMKISNAAFKDSVSLEDFAFDDTPSQQGNSQEESSIQNSQSSYEGSQKTDSELDLYSDEESKNLSQTSEAKDKTKENLLPLSGSLESSCSLPNYIEDNSDDSEYEEEMTQNGNFKLQTDFDSSVGTGDENKESVETSLKLEENNFPAEKNEELKIKDLSSPACTLNTDVDPAHTLKFDYGPVSTLKSDASPTHTLKSDTGPTPTLKSDVSPARTLKSDSDPVSTLKSDTGPAHTLKSDASPAKSDTGPTHTLKSDASPAKSDTGPTHTLKSDTGSTHTLKSDASPAHTLKSDASPAKSDTGPAHTLKSDTGPAHTLKSDTGSAHTLKSDASPAHTLKSDASPAHTLKSDTGPAHTLKSDASPTHTLKSDTGPAHTLKSDASPTHTLKSDTGPAHTLKSDVSPARTLKSDSDPVSTLKSDTGPAHTLKSDASPAKSDTGPTHTLKSDASPAKSDTGPTHTLKSDTGSTHTLKSDASPAHTLKSDASPAKSDTGPAHTLKSDTGPAHTLKSDTGPAHTLKSDASPAHTLKSDASPAHTLKSDTGPAHTLKSDASPTHTLKSDTGPAHTLKSDASPTHTLKSDTGPAHTLKSDASPTHTLKSDTGPAHTLKSDASPAHTLKSDTGPAHTLKSDASPTHTLKSDTGPAHTLKSDASPTHTLKSDTGSTHTLKSDASPAHTLKSDASPAKSDASPAHTLKSDTGPAHTLKSDASPTHTLKSDTGPTHTLKSDASPAKSDASPAHTLKSDTGPAHTLKSDASPTHTLKSDTGPAHTLKSDASPAKSDTGPTHTLKSDTGPAHTLKSDASPAKSDTGPARTLKSDASPTHTLKSDTGPAHTLKSDASPAKSDTGPARTLKSDASPTHTLKSDTGPAHTLKSDTGPAWTFKSDAGDNYQEHKMEQDSLEAANISNASDSCNGQTDDDDDDDEKIDVKKSKDKIDLRKIFGSPNSFFEQFINSEPSNQICQDQNVSSVFESSKNFEDDCSESETNLLRQTSVDEVDFDEHKESSALDAVNSDELINRNSVDSPNSIEEKAVDDNEQKAEMDQLGNNLVTERKENSFSLDLKLPEFEGRLFTSTPSRKHKANNEKEECSQEKYCKMDLSLKNIKCRSDRIPTKERDNVKADCEKELKSEAGNTYKCQMENNGKENLIILSPGDSQILNLNASSLAVSATDETLKENNQLSKCDNEPSSSNNKNRKDNQSLNRKDRILHKENCRSSFGNNRVPPIDPSSNISVIRSVDTKFQKCNDVTEIKLSQESTKTDDSIEIIEELSNKKTKLVVEISDSDDDDCIAINSDSDRTLPPSPDILESSQELFSSSDVITDPTNVCDLSDNDGVVIIETGTPIQNGSERSRNFLKEKRKKNRIIQLD